VILLDTHVLIWARDDSPQLSRAAASAIRRARRADGFAISAISLWELALLLVGKRIYVRGTTDESIRLLTHGVNIRPLTPEIAALATTFPVDFPRDPADRLIGATALAEGMTLITRDESMRRSPLLKTLW
jgi:PIN domain nuclease of toxin-antitoxin system